MLKNINDTNKFNFTFTNNHFFCFFFNFLQDIISMTWALDPDIRPQFSTLLKAFERIPKKRLIRSPSQPTYLTRSANALLI